MLFTAILTIAALATAYTRPPGPPYPPHILNKENLKLLDLTDLTAIFDDFIFDKYNDTSGVITAWLHDTQVIDYMKTSPLYPKFAAYDKNARFRVASITKLFTVLAVILSKDKLPMEASIQEFIPDLNENYKEVTIGALASHTSGLGYFVSIATAH